jgi:hypothetical protein
MPRSHVKPGDVFGRLTVVKRVPWGGRSRLPRWRVRCACGRKFEMFSNSLGVDSKGRTRQQQCRICSVHGGGVERMPSRLTEEDVKGVRERTVTGNELGAKYGVCDKVVWRWLEDRGVEAWWGDRGMELVRVEDDVLAGLCLGGEAEVVAEGLGIGFRTAQDVLRGVDGVERSNSKSDEKRIAWEKARKGVKVVEIASELVVSKQRVMQMIAWWCGRRVGERVKAERERVWRRGLSEQAKTNGDE